MDYRIEIFREGYFTEEFANFPMQPGYETVYNLDLHACAQGQCQPSLMPIRVLPSCA